MRDNGLSEIQADALIELFRQLRVDGEVEPSAGFYGRVLDRLTIERQSVWFPIIYSPVPARIAVVCAMIGCSALVLFMKQPTPAKSDDSFIAALTSANREDQRDAVLSQFVAYSSTARPAE